MDRPIASHTALPPHSSHLLRRLQANLTYHSEANEWRLD